MEELLKEGEQFIGADSPFVHDDTPAAKPVEKPAEKSDVEKRLEALEKELSARDKRISELQDSERYWAGKAKETRKPEPEPEADDEPEPDEEKPEKLLDDLSTKGVRAFRDRGFVSKAEVERLVNAKLNATLEQVTEGQKFDAKLQSDFPELMDQKSELFKRAGAAFREMVELDPKAKNSRVALYAAAKLAKRELEAEAKVNDRDDKEERRRERIASQAPTRSRSRENEGGGDLDMSPQARQVIKNLERFGVTEESFKAHTGGTRRGR